MNRRTKVLVALWTIIVAVTAWHATAPNPYFQNRADTQFAEHYPWQYPVLAAIVGAVVILFLRPWRTTHSFIGATLGFVLSFTFSVSVFLSLMHAPPVHTTVAMAFFFVSLGLLFYAGFAFAHLWADRSRQSTAD